MNHMNHMDRIPMSNMDSRPQMTQKSRWHPKTLDLSGARVLITGATSGIGKACAFRYQELGCHLILIGRDESKLQSLGVELAQENQCSPRSGDDRMHELIRLDVCDVDRVQQLADHVGYVDILINNAGCNLGGDPADMVKTDNMQKMVFTNYLAPMAFVAAFAPLMKQRGSGHIINIVSTAADDIYPNSSVYCSTKAALAAYTTAARHDLVDTPIRVTSISPGLVDTPLHEKKVGSLEQSRKTFDAIVPLYAEDVADQVIYVTTRAKHVQIADLSSYATNQSHSGAKGIPGVARVGPSLGGRMEDQRNNGPNMHNHNGMPSMQNMQRGPTSQDSNADRDRHDAYNKNSSGNRHEVPFYMLQNNDRSNPMAMNGDSRPSTPTNARPNTGYDRMNDGHGDNNSQSPYRTNYDINRNGYLSKGDNRQNGGMMPGQMNGELPGQMPGQMPYGERNERDNYRGPGYQRDHTPERSRNPYEQNRDPNGYMNPSAPEYQKNSNPQSGSNFAVRHV